MIPHSLRSKLTAEGCLTCFTSDDCAGDQRYSVEDGDCTLVGDVATGTCGPSEASGTCDENLCFTSGTAPAASPAPSRTATANSSAMSAPASAASPNAIRLSEFLDHLDRLAASGAGHGRDRKKTLGQRLVEPEKIEARGLEICPQEKPIDLDRLRLNRSALPLAPAWIDPTTAVRFHGPQAR